MAPAYSLRSPLFAGVIAISLVFAAIAMGSMAWAQVSGEDSGEVVTVDPIDDTTLPSMLDDGTLGSGDPSLAPIAFEDASDLALGFYSDVGYQDQEGRFVIDVLEQDFAYLTLIVTDAGGRSVVGAKPSFRIQGRSHVTFPKDDPVRSLTRNDGTVDFGVIGGEMGLEEITVKVGDASAKIRVNVISLEALGFPALPIGEVDLTWDQLMGAKPSWQGEQMSVAFPPDVVEMTGKRVKLSGFMMPLDPDLKQQRFLLTSNPPSCFFHVPGGPAGAIEVFAPDGIEATWDPILLEGRFETLSESEFGVIYQLHDAEIYER